MVAATDLKVFKTTNNLGGAITATQVISGTPNNVFTNVPKNELVVGEDYYACVWLKNGHATESMDNFSVWLTNKSFPSNTEIKWGFDPTIPSITFDGSNDYIDCTNDATLWSQSLTKFSFSFNMFATAIGDGNNRVVVDHGYTAGTNNGFGCYLEGGSNTITFIIKVAGNNYFAWYDFPSQSDVLNKWVKIVCTYDNSLGSNNLKIYVDSVLSPNHETQTASINLSATLTLANSTTDFKGNMKDFRWWTTTALTQTEIDDIYNDVVTAPAPDYWLKMDEGTGNPVDFVSNSKVGTLTNGAAWNTNAQTIADKYTAPLDIDWQTIGSAPSSPNYGKLNAGSSFPIWIWYHVPANAVETLDDSETFGFKFDIPQGGSGSGGGSDCAEGTYHYEPYGNFVDLSGSDRISVAEPTAPDITPPFSLACWFKTTFNYNTNIFGYMVHKGVYASGTTNYSLLINTDIDPPNHAVETMFQINTTTYRSASTNQSGAPFLNVNDGQWHLAVGTYDGSQLKIYVDGSIGYTDDTEGAVPATNNNNLIIGGGSGAPFIGSIDEVRIWNVALTAQEISDLYDNGDVPQSSAIVYSNTFGGSGAECGGSGGSGGNPPPTNTDYKIAIAGDWGCEPETNDVIDLIQSEGYDHVVGVGDNAYESASCWTSRFNPIKSIMNSAYGNHEYSESGGTGPYKTFFGHSLTYFKYKFQNILFMVIDTNISTAVGSTQHNAVTQWLQDAANDNTITWKIAIMHHPWYGASSDHSYNEFNQRQNFHNLFDQHKVSFVCTGHNHNWQRTHQIRYNSSSNGSPTVVDNTSPYSRSVNGIIHVVSGTGGHDTGGSLYSLGSQPSYQAYQNRTHNGVWEIVASNNAQTLTCSFRNTDGDAFDTFVINA